MPVESTPPRYHKPNVDEYGNYYRGQRVFPAFSTWYSGFLTDEDGRVYMLRASVFPSHSSYYPGGEVEVALIDPHPGAAAEDVPATS